MTISLGTSSVSAQSTSMISPQVDWKNTLTSENKRDLLDIVVQAMQKYVAEPYKNTPQLILIAAKFIGQEMNKASTRKEFFQNIIASYDNLEDTIRNNRQTSF